MKAGPHPLLAQGKVRYVGDPVAVVVADTYQQAKDAGEALDVDYAELDPVVMVRDAHDAGILVHDEVANNLIFDWEIGDKAATDAAFARAAHVTRMDLVNQRLVEGLPSQVLFDQLTPLGDRDGRKLHPCLLSHIFRRYWPPT